MNSGTTLWLSGALLVLVLLASLGQRDQQPITTRGEDFLPGLADALDEVSAIELIRAGNETFATLERGESNWTVQQKDGYPADLNKTRHLLLSLAETQILEAKTAAPALHDRLGVEALTSETAGGVGVRLIGTTEPVEVIVGDTEGSYQRYVRRQGENQSYLINRDPEIGTEASDWLDTTILTLARDRLQYVTVTRPDGEVVMISKAVRGQQNFTVDNIPEGRAIRYDSIPNVMGNVLEDLSLEDVERATETDEPTILTEFRTFDGLEITVHSLERDDTAWVSFAAMLDPALPEGSEETREAAETEAAEINARLEGWRYQIPTFKFEQLTRTMEDLLQELEEEDTAE
ncbi:MAG: DUF4340 domain-containing protein [Candidatus Rariloculaceae bacterium]